MEKPLVNIGQLSKTPFFTLVQGANARKQGGIIGQKDVADPSFSFAYRTKGLRILTLAQPAKEGDATSTSGDGRKQYAKATTTLTVEGKDEAGGKGGIRRGNAKWFSKNSVLMYRGADGISEFLKVTADPTSATSLTVSRNFYSADSQTPENTTDSSTFARRGPQFMKAGDELLYVGEATPEGAVVSKTSTSGIVRRDNYCQLFSSSIEHTVNSATTQTDEFGDYYRSSMEVSKEVLMDYYEKQENALLFGQRHKTTDAKGISTWMTGGLDFWLEDSHRFKHVYRGNVADATYLSGTSSVNFGLQAKTGLTGRWDANSRNSRRWLEALDELFYVPFQYTTDDKTANKRIALCGHGFMRTLNSAIAEGVGIERRLNEQPSDTFYGLSVVNYVCPYGTIEMMPHPLMSLASPFANTAYIIDPFSLRVRVHRPPKMMSLKHDKREGFKDADVYGIRGQTGLQCSNSLPHCVITI